MTNTVATVTLTLALATAPMTVMATDASTDPPSRPAIKTNRWEEDWSALADPRLRTQPLDDLKYIPLSATDPDRYLSLGATLRERYEFVHAPAFGIGTGGDAYLLQRLQVHADLRLDRQWQLFTQLEDVRAYGKSVVTPVDRNPLDLRLAFVAYTRSFDHGTLKARIGRQDFLFDLQRFVSSRDGPNVRQSFDAAWLDWESGPWRFLGFLSQPVQYRDAQTFDDTSNGRFRFHTLRVERHVLGGNELSGYYARYERDGVSLLDARGDERRNVYDVRFAGTQGAVDWDLETMGQNGTLGPKRIRAWAFGARAGYTFAGVWLRPRLGLQLDAASGDRQSADGVVGTFNPLFPNGYYFSLAGYTGYANLVHVKPSLTVHPSTRLAITGALAAQWRQTTQDAIYTQPNVPVAGTAGSGGRYTGTYAQLRIDYAINRQLTAALEAVHFQVGPTLRAVGGRNGDYIGTQLKFGW